MDGFSLPERLKPDFVKVERPKKNKFKDNHPAPEKERMQLLWAVHMNGLKAQVEEAVVREIVYAE